MTLFYCIDIANKYLKKLNNDSRAERDLLESIIKKLNKHASDNDYDDFSDIQDEILEYKNQNQTDKTQPNYLDEINDDLNAMQRQRKRYKKPDQCHPSLIAYKPPAYQLGKGACYGMTFSMAVPEVSPFYSENKGKEIIQLNLTEKAHVFQKSQRNRHKDQQSIKKTRLTRKYFCPNSEQRASEIYSFAEKNPGKDLYIRLNGFDITTPRKDEKFDLIKMSTQPKNLDNIKKNTIILYNNKLYYVCLRQGEKKLINLIKNKKTQSDYNFISNCCTEKPTKATAKTREKIPSLIGSAHLAHACYFRKNCDEFWYMDSNFGAYIFKSEKEFKEFYMKSCTKYRNGGRVYSFYSINEIQYDPELKLKESKTWKGKLRTLLTGNKYTNNFLISYLSNILIEIVPSVIGLASGATLGAAIGAIIGTIILPGAGTLAFAAIFAMLGGLVGLGCTLKLQALANKNKKEGWLAIPHYLMESRYLKKERQKDEEPKQKNTDDPVINNNTMNLILEKPPQTNKKKKDEFEVEKIVLDTKNASENNVTLLKNSRVDPIHLN